MAFKLSFTIFYIQKKYLHERILKLWYHQYDICPRIRVPWEIAMGKYIFQLNPGPANIEEIHTKLLAHITIHIQIIECN